jgi:hypothetical protein
MIPVGDASVSVATDPKISVGRSAVEPKVKYAAAAATTKAMAASR